MKFLILKKICLFHSTTEADSTTIERNIQKKTQQWRTDRRRNEIKTKAVNYKKKWKEQKNIIHIYSIQTSVLSMAATTAGQISTLLAFSLSFD